jgi:hypothetical protein
MENIDYINLLDEKVDEIESSIQDLKNRLMNKSNSITAESSLDDIINEISDLELRQSFGTEFSSITGDSFYSENNDSSYIYDKIIEAKSSNVIGKFLIKANDGYLWTIDPVFNIEISDETSLSFLGINNGNLEFEVLSEDSVNDIEIRINHPNSGTGYLINCNIYLFRIIEIINEDTNVPSYTGEELHVKDGESVNLPYFNYDGYDVDYYNTESDGSGTNYSPGESVTPSSDFQLYTFWVSSNGSDNLVV